MCMFVTRLLIRLKKNKLNGLFAYTFSPLIRFSHSAYKLHKNAINLILHLKLQKKFCSKKVKRTSTCVSLRGCFSVSLRFIGFIHSNKFNLKQLVATS